MIRKALNMTDTPGLLLLILLSPVGFSWPLSEPVNGSVLPLFATAQLYPGDLAIMLLIPSLITADRSLRVRSAISAALGAICLLALASALSHLPPGLALYFAVRWLVGLMVFLAVRQSRTPLSQVALVLAGGLLLHTLIGIGQFLARGPLGLPGELALPAKVGGAAVIETLSGRMLRAYGLAFHPNVLGGFLTIALLLLLPALRSSRVRILWWALVTGLLFTFSRGAWLAAAVTLPAAGLMLMRKHNALRRPLIVTAAGAMLICTSAAFLLAAPLRTRLLITPMETEQASIQNRRTMAVVALETAITHPLIGIGPGLYPLEIANYARINPDPVHNVPLLLAAEIGLAGGILWLSLFLFLAWRIVTTRGSGSAGLTALLFACMAVGIVSLFDYYPWGLESGRLLTMTLLGLTDRQLNAAGL